MNIFSLETLPVLPATSKGYSNAIMDADEGRLHIARTKVHLANRIWVV
jgi:hypothetical protein